MDTDKLAALRKPFPREVIGKLPKGGAMLDFCGHAAVTDRLLSVDPEWTWEPMALTPEGLPLIDRSGNLWIRLTVCGVTRLGVGDGKSMKELIGDALRNAAMRFGVALDLWSKDELESTLDQPEKQNIPKGAGGKAKPATRPADPKPETGELITDPQMRAMRATLAEVGLSDRDEILAEVAAIIGHPIASSKDLTRSEASKVIDRLKSLSAGATEGAVA